jgi:hypothetical protein
MIVPLSAFVVICEFQVKEQESPEGRWVCPDCTSGLQRCKLCGEVGPVGTESLNDSDDETKAKASTPKLEVYGLVLFARLAMILQDVIELWCCSGPPRSARDSLRSSSPTLLNLLCLLLMEVVLLPLMQNSPGHRRVRRLLQRYLVLTPPALLPLWLLLIQLAWPKLPRKSELLLHRLLHLPLWYIEQLYSC